MGIVNWYLVIHSEGGKTLKPESRREENWRGEVQGKKEKKSVTVSRLFQT